MAVLSLAARPDGVGDGPGAPSAATGPIAATPVVVIAVKDGRGPGQGGSRWSHHREPMAVRTASHPRAEAALPRRGS